MIGGRGVRPLTPARGLLAAALLAAGCAASSRPATAPAGQLVAEQPGHVTRVGDFGYGIVPDADPGTRYAPEAPLPADLQVEGLRVVFAGALLEPPPGARLWGTPLRVTAIRRAD